MKEDKKLRRGAMVKALAICTPNPYFGIYKVMKGFQMVADR